MTQCYLPPNKSEHTVTHPTREAEYRFITILHSVVVYMPWVYTYKPKVKTRSWAIAKMIARCALCMTHQRYRQTDRQTDRRTDDMRSQDRALHQSASRGKNTAGVALVQCIRDRKVRLKITDCQWGSLKETRTFSFTQVSWNKSICGPPRKEMKCRWS